MAKQLIKGFLVYRTASYWDADERVTFSMYDPRECGTGDKEIVIREHEFEVEYPDDFDPRPQQIAELEKAKRKVRAEFAKAVKDIDDRIASLLAIENAS
jgi:hypothetical protein